MIKVLGFTVIYDGDTSVGIFPERWELRGKYNFDDEEHYQKFKSELLGLFELISDTPLRAEPIVKALIGDDGEFIKSLNDE